jgi:hypothetical protein
VTVRVCSNYTGKKAGKGHEGIFSSLLVALSLARVNKRKLFFYICGGFILRVFRFQKLLIIDTEQDFGMCDRWFESSCIDNVRFLNVVFDFFLSHLQTSHIGQGVRRHNFNGHSVATIVELTTSRTAVMDLTKDLTIQSTTFGTRNCAVCATELTLNHEFAQKVIAAAQTAGAVETNFRFIFRRGNLAVGFKRCHCSDGDFDFVDVGVGIVVGGR